jgi:ribosomal protein S27AE
MFRLFRKRKKDKPDIKPEIKLEGKYLSKPIYREVAIHPSKNQCPKCGSYFTKPARYGDRLECDKCGKVFN